MASVPRPVSSAASFRTFFLGLPGAATPRHDGRWLVQRALKLATWAYLRLVHDYRMHYHPELPQHEPYIAVISHTSWLDVPALMAFDPFDPPSIMVIKEEPLRIPILGALLRAWGAIGVSRSGRDISALRKIREALGQGRGICIAPSGTRSADGRLGPFNPVLIRLILGSNVTVVPLVIIGSYEALPKGSKRLHPTPIWLDSGGPIDLADLRGHRVTDADLETAALRLRAALEAILPPSMHHAPETPVLGRYLEPTSA